MDSVPSCKVIAAARRRILCSSVYRRVKTEENNVVDVEGFAAGAAERCGDDVVESGPLLRSQLRSNPVGTERLRNPTPRWDPVGGDFIIFSCVFRAEHTRWRPHTWRSGVCVYFRRTLLLLGDSVSHWKGWLGPTLAVSLPTPRGTLRSGASRLVTL